MACSLLVPGLVPSGDSVLFCEEYKRLKKLAGYHQSESCM